MNSFGSRLRSLRLRRNMKQEDVAEKLNISKSAVSMYERDEREPSFQLIKQMADFFNVSTDSLLGHDMNRNESVPFTLDQLSDDEVEYLKESLEIYRKMKRKDWHGGNN